MRIKQLNNSHRRSRPTRHAEFPDWSGFFAAKKEEKNCPAMPLESESLGVSQLGRENNNIKGKSVTKLYSRINYNH